MRTAIYPGSFNPWHLGHQDVLEKALKVFDKVVIMQGNNLSKATEKDQSFMDLIHRYPNVAVGHFTGLLADHIASHNYDAVIRGLRNGNDLDYEVNLQYWNEDLGVDIPFVHFITDRKYIHISSSAIREVEAIRNKP